MYRSVIKPVFFLFSPENAHKIIVFMLSIPFVVNLLKILFNFQHPSLKTEFAGLIFKNPVGLAAGFDKEAALVDPLAALGFSFIEIGTITPKAQPGNPKPRLFRLPGDEALINRMGFNNKGLESAIINLKKTKVKDVLIGGNIGKNKLTPLDNAIEDYEICFEELFPYVDYFVVNVSSPNTPNLRQLQDKKPLSELLTALMKLNRTKENPKPIFLKIAPDLSNGQLDDIIEIVPSTGIAGIVATNTSILREGLKADPKEVERIGAGGLSGKPLTKRSTEIIRYLHEKAKGSIPIIAVGGIHSAEDALEKLEAGAGVIQLYSGFIYEGPGLIKRINKAILKARQS